MSADQDREMSDDRAIEENTEADLDYRSVPSYVLAQITSYSSDGTIPTDASLEDQGNQLIGFDNRAIQAMQQYGTIIINQVKMKMFINAMMKYLQAMYRNQEDQSRLFGNMQELVVKQGLNISLLGDDINTVMNTGLGRIRDFFIDLDHRNIERLDKMYGATAEILALIRSGQHGPIVPVPPPPTPEQMEKFINDKFTSQMSDMNKAIVEGDPTHGFDSWSNIITQRIKQMLMESGTPGDMGDFWNKLSAHIANLVNKDRPHDVKPGINYTEQLNRMENILGKVHVGQIPTLSTKEDAKLKYDAIMARLDDCQTKTASRKQTTDIINAINSRSGGGGGSSDGPSTNNCCDMNMDYPIPFFR